MKHNDKKVRVIIDISEEAAERLDILKDSTIGGNRSACIRQSLQLFEYVVERIAEGDRLFVGKDKETVVELKIFGLV